MDVCAHSVEVDRDAFILVVISSAVDHVGCRTADGGVESQLHPTLPLSETGGQQECRNAPLRLVHRV